MHPRRVPSTLVTQRKTMLLGALALTTAAITACGPATNHTPVTRTPVASAAGTSTSTESSSPAQPQAGNTPAAAPGGALPIGDSKSPMPLAGSCHAGNRNGQPLPDPTCTPGATNPAVTPSTIRDTICKSGWTSTVRPPTSVTNKMKTESARSYGLAPTEKGEYDHLVSLELGGAADDPRNRWVEIGSIPNLKDAVENSLNRAVCAGLIPLPVAQTAIAHQWVTAFGDAGLRVAGAKICLVTTPLGALVTNDDPPALTGGEPICIREANASTPSRTPTAPTSKGLRRHARPADGRPVVITADTPMDDDHNEPSPQRRPRGGQQHHHQLLAEDADQGSMLMRRSPGIRGGSPQ